MEESIVDASIVDIVDKRKLEEILKEYENDIREEEAEVQTERDILAETMANYHRTVKRYIEVLMNEGIRRITMERVGSRIFIYCAKTTPEGEEREAIEMVKFWEVGDAALCQAIKEGKITDELLVYDDAVVRPMKNENGEIYLEFVTLRKSRLEK